MRRKAKNTWKKLGPVEETWRVFRIMSEFVEGFELMSQCEAGVSVFGSSRAQRGDRFYQLAEELARVLAGRGFSVITGGGPGIMEAANKGAFEAGGTSIGLNIYLPQEQAANQYQTVSMDFRYFFCRKVMFVKHAVAFVCFPGGFGTMDEFFESMTLIQTGKSPTMKVVLMGSEFWHPLADWMRALMLRKYHNIDPGDLNLFTVTDDVNQAVNEICTFYKTHRTDLEPPPVEAEWTLKPHERMTAEGTRFGVPPKTLRRAQRRNHRGG
jgi:uncharacterized protein (TIGR00730 family)